MLRNPKSTEAIELTNEQAQLLLKKVTDLQVWLLVSVIINICLIDRL